MTAQLQARLVRVDLAMAKEAIVLSRLTTAWVDKSHIYTELSEYSHQAELIVAVTQVFLDKHGQTPNTRTLEAAS